MMKEWFDRLGIQGTAGLGLLMFCLYFALASVLPLRGELEALEAEQLRLAAAGASGAVSAGVVSASLPGFRQMPELFRSLDALAAEHGVFVERTAYVIRDTDGRGPLRLEVSMPLKVSYPALRAYLRDALALPGASLDELSLERSRAVDSAIAAQVRLSYGFQRLP